MVGRVAFLTDRSPAEVLPALPSLGFDVKTEPLGPESLPHLRALAPSILFVDAEPNPDQAFRLLRLLVSDGPAFPSVVVVAREDLARYPWAEVADEFVHSGSPTTELSVRVAMLTRRSGSPGESSLRLGALSLDVDTYQVSLAGRVLDLTYKEFELLRFLLQRPERVFTRNELLSEVWGYDFYGGTRTVDVHVRRLRAKLGPEHEGLIQTVRGVGYRAAQPRHQEEDEPETDRARDLP